MKTYDELELEAYIRGDTSIAGLYARLSQNEDMDGELADTYDRIRDLEWDVDYLSKTNEDLEDDVEHWRKRAIKAEGELEEAKYVLESLSK